MQSSHTAALASPHTPALCPPLTNTPPPTPLTLISARWYLGGGGCWGPLLTLPGPEFTSEGFADEWVWPAVTMAAVLGAWPRTTTTLAAGATDLTVSEPAGAQGGVTFETELAGTGACLGGTAGVVDVAGLATPALDVGAGLETRELAVGGGEAWTGISSDVVGLGAGLLIGLGAWPLLLAEELAAGTRLFGRLPVPRTMSAKFDTPSSAL